MVESIAGLRTPDAGRIEVFGFDRLVDRAAVRSRLGVQLQESRFQDRVKVSDVVETVASFYPDPLDGITVLERLGFEGRPYMAAYAVVAGSLAIWLFRWD